jgi:hypothetical protein
LHFTLEWEEDQKINFLDLAITMTENGLPYDIFRKHITTDTIIPHDSCHPLEQKMAAIRYYVNRIDTYNLDQEKDKKKWTSLNRSSKAISTKTKL